LFETWSFRRAALNPNLQDARYCTKWISSTSLVGKYLESEDASTCSLFFKMKTELYVSRIIYYKVHLREKLKRKIRPSELTYRVQYCDMSAETSRTAL
jgi:hypothetical protein